MRDLFKLLVVILIAFIIALALHLTLKTLDKTNAINLKETKVAGNEKFEPLDSSEPINIVTWNIDNAAWVDNKDYEYKLVTQKNVYDNLMQISSQINGFSFNPHIVTLQNVDKVSERSARIDSQSILTNALKNSCSSFYTFDTYNTLYTFELPFTSRHSGFLTFSHVRASSTNSAVLYSGPETRSKLFSEKNVAQNIRYQIKGTNVMLSLFSINLSDDKKVNATQLENLIKEILNEYNNGNIVIVAGTWNALFEKNSSYNWKGGYLQKVLSSLLDSGWKFVTDDSNPTAGILDNESKSINYYPLDAFLVSPGVNVKRTRTLSSSKPASSHSPLMLNAVLNPSLR